MKKILVSGILAAATLFGFNLSNQPVQNSNCGFVIEGKVIKAYTQKGYGPKGFEWLFMDVKTKNKIIKVGIAPTFRISNLPVNEGDIVKIKGFTPPYWPTGVIKAWDIYDESQHRDYVISGWGRNCQPVLKQ
jgi:hypothetical protein